MGSLARLVTCAVAAALSVLPAASLGSAGPAASARAHGDAHAEGGRAAYAGGPVPASVAARTNVSAQAGGEVASFTIQDPRITESSGLAASRAHPGVYWTHNDSDDGPYVYAVDAKSGRTVATVTLRGIGDPRDVEAISVGPDGTVYVADIGDNLGGTWPKVWIYAFPEPKRLADTTVTAKQYTVQYDGGPRDAEAMMVHPTTGRVYIVSKHKQDGGLYAGPQRLSTTGTNTFKRIGGVDQWVTDGAFSPDGEQLVLRSYFDVALYTWRGGKPKKLGEPDLPIQQQGESVTYTLDGGTLMYGTEGEHSRVSAERLDDDLVSDGTRRQREKDERASGGKGSGADSKDADANTDNYYLGGLILVVCTAIGIGGRRLLRSR
ncbi:esterase-like activity of phytase family protein [Streptomyces zagrosensis]|uniref:WD40 repeat domain-containing protein n=1 Tax=Streptomyces zagrosensis TaxID=1042984 RepID=A0A7W9UX66_9ACTN|nr:esterase-like activity of phytase family protein [Streptomyces zagrosensis]MBB5934635.1 hypothetical protein [Streptomyces zagrosensis]